MNAIDHDPITKVCNVIGRQTSWVNWVHMTMIFGLQDHRYTLCDETVNNFFPNANGIFSTGHNFFSKHSFQMLMKYKVHSYNRNGLCAVAFMDDHYPVRSAFSLLNTVRPFNYDVVAASLFLVLSVSNKMYATGILNWRNTVAGTVCSLHQIVRL
ncbi:VAMP-like protein YKT61 [Platanthera guangdongensis]|uniref:VAMP-like protein YKT61 n=1 Tax=Platanthera guangdongensis TaxID=2320717 RepID=A0ABR2MTY2_9ASPA